MELFEYIKSQLPQMPNSAIMKQLGASQELIDYVKETPENTNLNIMGSIGDSGSEDIGEVWFTGSEYYDEDGAREFYLLNVGETDHKTELLTNPSNYQIFLNGEELPFLVTPQEGFIVWADAETEEALTKTVRIIQNQTQVAAVFIDSSAAPTSVEVSVKAK